MNKETNKQENKVTVNAAQKKMTPEIKKGIKILWLSFMLCLAALPVFATEIHISDETPVTVKGMDEAEDHILLSDTSTFSGKAGDIIMFSRVVNMEGVSSYSAILMGETVNIQKDIGNDLYAAGSKVNINGNIGDNVYLAGSDLSIGADSVVNGTIIAIGKDFRINGEVYGDVYAGVGFLTIDGTVHGNIYAEAQRITITERGSVKGDITYLAERGLSEKEIKRVDGLITVKTQSAFGCAQEDINDGQSFGPGKNSGKFGFAVVSKLIFLFSILISGLLILLFPGFSKVYKEKRESGRFWQSLLWGLIPLLIYPVATGILMMILPLGISMILIALPLGGLTIILGLTLLGQYLFKAFNWKSNNRHLHFLFACGLFGAILIVPILSNLVTFALSALGWGVILELLFNKKFGTKDQSVQIEDKSSSKE